MYRYDAQTFSFYLSIFFLCVSILHIIIRIYTKERYSIWIYVLQALGWSISVVFYICVLVISCGAFSGHEWSPMVRVLQYVSFGTWMFFTFIEKLFDEFPILSYFNKIYREVTNIWKQYTNH